MNNRLIDIFTYDEKEIRKIIFQNALKMLFNREEISKEDYNKYNEKVEKERKYYYKLGNFLLKYFESETTKKDEHYNDLIKNDIKKILIVQNKNIINKFINYPNTEIFTKDDMMIDLISNILQPKYIKLTDEEKKTFYEDFNVLNSQIPILLYTDKVRKYFNYNIGDIIKIIRNNPINGVSISYRIVK